jgi:replicative DNA helicase
MPQPHPAPADPQLATLRVPPHSIEAEQSVIGALLLDNAAWERIADVVAPDDFYRDDHRRIFKHIGKLIDGAKPADVVTVAESIEASEDKDKSGGIGYLGQLAQNTPSAHNVRRYAEIVRERAIMRRLIATASDIADGAFSPAGKDVAQLLDEAESKIFEIAEAGARGRTGFVAIQPLLAQVMERIDTLYHRDNPSDVTGVPTGFDDLDGMTSGLQEGELIIVAGRPSMGKTAFSLNIAEYVAVEQRLPVAVFSMEMSGSQLAMRLLGSIGRLDQHKLRTARLSDEDWGRLTNAVEKLHDAPIHIDETPALNALELRARSRRLHRQYGKLGLIVIDYLQLMSASSLGENRATEISEISRSLKALAKELHVPVIALSQLNRSLEQRPNKRPVMSDLRECVTGDTLVLCADGRRVPIASLVGTTPEVWAVDGAGKLVAARSDAVWCMGVKPVQRLHLASGRSLVATGRHRVLTGSAWKELRELSPGDRVALARRVPQPDAKVEWPEPELVLLGHLVGDGSYLAGQPLRYTTASEDNSEAVRKAAEALGSIVTRYAGRGPWHQLVIGSNGDRWRPAGVGQWLKRLFGQRSHQKRLPAEVFRLPDEQVALLLRHLWATDGSISLRKPGQEGAPRVFFSTCSAGLAGDVAALLLRLGIVARLRTVHPSHGRPRHIVDVSGTEAQSHFAARVGGFGPCAAPALALQGLLASRGANTNVDCLPREAFAEVRARTKGSGVTTRTMAALRGTAYGGTSHFRFAPSRDMMREYAFALDDTKLAASADSDLFWDTVVRIDDAGEQEVFDLTVPGPASWLADGVVSHNSGAIEQDADVILFIYRDEVYNPDTADKGKAEIIIGKQRNGPIGTIDLTFLGQHTRFENYAAPNRF